MQIIKKTDKGEIREAPKVVIQDQKKEVINQKQGVNNQKQEKAVKKVFKKVLKQLEDKSVQRIFIVENVTHDGFIISPMVKKEMTPLLSLTRTLLYPDKFNKDKVYSTIIKFEDLNYQILQRDQRKEILTKYAQFLSLFDTTLHVQLTIRNKKLDPAEIYEKVHIKGGDPDLQEYIEDYNNILKRHFTEDISPFEQEKFITISTINDTPEIAKRSLEKVSDDVKNHFVSIGVNSKRLSAEEVIKLLSSMFSTPVDVLQSGPVDIKDVKSIISPGSAVFRYTDAILDGKYFAFLIIKKFPPQLSDRFLYHILNTGVESNITIHITPFSQAEALRLAKNKLAEVEGVAIEQTKKAAQSGVMYTPFKLQKQIENIKAIIDDIQENGMNLYATTLIITVIGNSEEELNLGVAKVRRAFSEIASGGQLSDLASYQEVAMNSVLPAGVNYIPIDTLLNTANIATLIPFTTKNYFDENGFYYGVNLVSNIPIIFDRTNLRNPNGFILGTPGSGKSFSAKREMVEVLLARGDDVLVIDPEREYMNLAHALGGVDIEIKNGSPYHINPFDINENYSDVSEEDPVSFKSDFILSLFNTVLGELSNVKQSILDRAVRHLYQYIEGRMPTLKDLYKLLQAYSELEARDLALELERFATGSLDLFSYPTDIDVDNRFIVYDIRDLGSSLKTMGMFVILDQIWNRITRNRDQKKRTWVYIDEIYLLFQNQYSREFLFKLFKRARKYGAVLTGITQNVEDLLRSDDARAMLANTDFLILLNQAPTDREILASVLKLSDQELRYISSSPPGQGILSIDHIFIPFRDRFPEDSKLYKLMTTKFGEV